MQLRTILFFSILFFSFPSLHAQEPGVLESRGAMPEIFRTSISEMVAKGIENDVSDGDNHRTRKTKSDFIVESNYFLSNVLTNGYVVYNHEINDYLDLVLQTLLQDNPLSESVSVYLLKSSRSNAFATHQGVIFITTGLLAQLENEAQLAYILGHEITHITEKHSIGYRIESAKKLTKKGAAKHSSFDYYIAQMSNYSQNLELEADDDAFDRLSNSVYDLNASLTVFDVLQFSYLPFDEIDFKLESFESTNFKLPKTLYLDEPTPIALFSDSSSSKSTHPSIGKRVEAMTDKMSSQSANGKKFVAPKAQFDHMQKLCRDQVIRSQLRKQEFILAYYNAEVMARFNPSSDYYKTAQAKALYGISKYRNVNKRPAVAPEDAEGSISRYYYFFDKLDKKELNLVALRKMRQLNATINDPFVQGLIENLTQDLIKIHEVKFTDLNFNAYKAPSIDSTAFEALAAGDTTKFGMLRKQREQAMIDKVKEEDSWKENFGDYTFVDEDKAAIEALFSKAKTEVALISTKDDSALSFREKNKAEKLRKRKGVSLGIDKIVYLNPEFIAINEKVGIEEIKSAKRQADFIQQIKEASSRAELEASTISPSIFTEQSTTELNTLGTFNYLMSEVNAHKKLAFKVDMIPLEANYSSALSNQLSTPYVCYTGVVTYQSPTPNKGGKLALSLLGSWFAPLFMTWTLWPKQYTYYFHTVVDTEKGAIIYQDEDFYKVKLGKPAINSLMYDKMIQIHRK